MRSIAITLQSLLRKYPNLHRQVRRVAICIPVIQKLSARLLRPHSLTPAAYRFWIQQNDTLTKIDFRDIQGHIERMSYRPLISVVMPVYNTDEMLLRKTVASVRAQIYPDWELCIADDASLHPAVWCVLQQEAAADSRIKIIRRTVNGHISAASNSALALATGEFVALLDHDDILPVQALYEIAAELNEHPDADIIYSDEDKIDDAGNRFDPYFKTDWNPELLLGQNFVSHLGIYRRRLLDEIGGFREGFEGSQDYDLVLRAIEHTTAARIRHIPAILYHWRQSSASASFSETDLARCAEAGRRAVAEHFERTGSLGATVNNFQDMPSFMQVYRPVPASLPLVSVIILTRDRAQLLRACMAGLLGLTNYSPFEIIIVDNGSMEADTLALLQKLEKDARVRVLRIEGPFNYADLNNRAATEAQGDILVLLNNDIEVIENNWLRAMVAQAVRPEVGAVGARLLYSNGRVQHGGIILGAGGVAGHLHRGALRKDNGFKGHLRLARNVSAVTGACLAVRRNVFEEVGGFDAKNFAVAFNDVDLCLKIRAKGYQIIWTPLAELYHLESASRGSDFRSETIARFQHEVVCMQERWGAVLDNDPFYGPNFDLMSEHYGLAVLSRRQRPWRAPPLDQSPERPA